MTEKRSGETMKKTARIRKEKGWPVTDVCERQITHLTLVL